MYLGGYNDIQEAVSERKRSQMNFMGNLQIFARDTDLLIKSNIIRFKIRFNFFFKSIYNKI